MVNIADAYEAFMLAETEKAAAKVKSAGSGKGFIPRLEVQDRETKKVRFLTDHRLSPRIYVHTHREGNMLKWSGKCTGNWKMPGVKCAGCEAGVKGQWIVVPLVYDYTSEGIMVTAKNGQNYPEKVLRRFPRSPTQTTQFIAYAKEQPILEQDTNIERTGEGTSTVYALRPATVRKSVVMDGTEQVVEVVAKSAFIYDGEDEQVIEVMKAVSRALSNDPEGVMTLFDTVLRNENYCPGQRGANGSLLGEKDANFPKNHLAALIMAKIIPDPTAVSDERKAPASRPGADRTWDDGPGLE
jgi:hypothetical protein